MTMGNKHPKELVGMWSMAKGKEQTCVKLNADGCCCYSVRSMEIAGPGECEEWFEGRGTWAIGTWSTRERQGTVVLDQQVAKFRTDPNEGIEVAVPSENERRIQDV